MKKVIVILLFTTILFSLTLVHSAESDEIAKSYNCLVSKVNSSCPSSAEDRAFVLLALPKLEMCKEEVINNPGSSLKEKALSLLALESIDENTTMLTKDLLSKKMVPSNLDWYLQVETSGAASCTASYGLTNADFSMTYDFTIGLDKKLSGSAGNCLQAGSEIKKGYWFKINSNPSFHCYDYRFKISCTSDTGFLTNLLYQEKDSNTLFVSSGTNRRGNGGISEETINSHCLRLSTTDNCDYEGTLWAAIALDYAGEKIDSFVPYLEASASKNPQFFPSAFLYHIKGESEYRSKITNELIKGKFLDDQRYWDVSGDRIFDTALAMYPFQTRHLDHPEIKEYAKNYLLDQRQNNGCWQTTKETAFVLHSLWQDLTPQSDVTDDPDNGLCETDEDCADQGENNTCFTDTGMCVHVASTGCAGNDQYCIDRHGEGYFCDDLNRCFYMPQRECTPETEDTDCGANQNCVNYVCKDIPGRPFCGDGAISNVETCDGTNWGGIITSCADLVNKNYTGGNLSCIPAGATGECTFNETLCYGEVDMCQDDDDCESPNSTCDEGVCVPPNHNVTSVCGNGIRETGESCDGTDWENVSECSDITFFDLGTLSCNSANTTYECEFNISLCHDETFECLNDSQCHTLYNESYECVLADGTCDLIPVDECYINSQCDDDEICNARGECVVDNGNGGDDNLPDCEDFDYYCRSVNDCTSDGGEVLDDKYSCNTPDRCCDLSSSVQTCGDLYGEICNSGQKCSGGTGISDTTDLLTGEVCCVGGYCEDKGSSDDVSNCEWLGGSCKTSCDSGETETDEECSSVHGEGYVCCESGATPDIPNERSYVWLWILLILIVLVVVGILFRDKLRIAFMKLKSGFGKGGQPPIRQGFPPPMGLPPQRPLLRRIIPSQPRPISSGGPQTKSLPPRPAPKPSPANYLQRPAEKPKPTEKPKPKSDLDDVLKKLKDMGK